MNKKLLVFAVALFTVVATPAQKAPQQKNQTNYNDVTNSQKPPQKSDIEIVETAESAQMQADGWIRAEVISGLEEGIQKHDDSAQKWDIFFDRIKLDEKNEKQWERTDWTIPDSELFPGEIIASHWGTGLTMSGTNHTLHQRFPDCSKKKICVEADDARQAYYLIDAPLDVKAHISMERLRHEISQWVGLPDFGADHEMFLNSWTGAWFDVRNVFCRLSSDAKYFDLNNEEQVCK